MTATTVNVIADQNQTLWVHEWDWVSKTCVELKRTQSWQQSIMEIRQKGLNIPMWFKVSIIWADPDTLLNKRTELISKCRHRNKFLLANVTICPNSFIDTEQNWHILCCNFFVKDLRQNLPFPLLINFHGSHSRKSINDFHKVYQHIFLSSFIAWRLF